MKKVFKIIFLKKSNKNAIGKINDKILLQKYETFILKCYFENFIWEFQTQMFLSKSVKV